MAAPVVHFEINAANAEQAQKFYADLFGWKINANNPMGYGLVKTGTKMGINGGIGKAEQGNPFVTVYAQVKNPQEYLDKAVALGAQVVVPVTVVPKMATYALFRDPDGNLVGIIEGRQAPRKKKAARHRRKQRR